MNCPVCKGKVKVAYCLSDNDSVIRKRECCECGHIFYTSEFIDGDANDLFHDLLCVREMKRRFKRKEDKNG